MNLGSHLIQRLLSLPPPLTRGSCRSDRPSIGPPHFTDFMRKAGPATRSTAFKGAYGAFLVTNFWAHASAAKETEEINVLVR
ncbi:hypothetical protein QFZ76_000838 [Streptomyces sp. V4I2]|nr:hypothetical protein [Streptomyces sp. V4I2]